MTGLATRLIAARDEAGGVFHFHELVADGKHNQALALGIVQDAVIHRETGDQADQGQGRVFGEESPKCGQFFVQEMVDIGAAQRALDAGQTNRFRGDGEGVVFLLPAIGPLALAPHGQIDDLLSEDLLHDARQAGRHQILDQRA